MNYIVFARKYRPQNFDELIGQEFIATTLKNAIQAKRIGHAYLFSGPRGIGKTSTARIFAKSINCETGPTAKPCQKCSSCKEISSGISMDVIEIDGASNRGIDEIRNLRENVKFGATHGKFKVYIIDEVHMLTQEAFNALLKTLEEPPPHVKFIFATTQPHKVPATILSRCQRFDFKRISTELIISKLKEIAKAEKLEIADEALYYIAKAAESSLRDAETILDQIGSFSKGKISKADIREALGTIEEDRMFRALECVASKDAKNALILINELTNEGKDLVQFASGLLDHTRNLLVAKVSGDSKKLIDLPSQVVEKIVEQSKPFTIEDLLYIIYFLMNTIEGMKKFGSPRIPLEAAFVKLVNRASIMPLGDMLEKLAGVEKRLSTGEIKTVQPDEDTRVEPKACIEKPQPSEEPQVQENPQTLQDNSSQPAGYTATATEAEEKDPSPPEVDIEKSDKIWSVLLKIMREKKMSVASYLLEGNIHSVEGSVFTIGFPSNYMFHKEALERLENRTLVEESLKDILKRDVRVKFMNFKQSKESQAPPSQNTIIAEPQEEITDPIVTSALRIFKGKVVKKKSLQRKAR